MLKKIIPLLVLLISTSNVFADENVSALSEKAVPADSDVMYIVDKSGSPFAPKNITVAHLRSSMGWTLSGSNEYNSNGGNVGIGSPNPSQKLDIAGTGKMSGFQLTASPTNGYILTSDTNGNGTWQVNSGGINYWTPSGSDIGNNNSGNVGIGTATSPSAKLTVQGVLAVNNGTSNTLLNTTGGNVGIGTNTPRQALDLGASGTIAIGIATTIPAHVCVQTLASGAAMYAC